MEYFRKNREWLEGEQGGMHLPIIILPLLSQISDEGHSSQRVRIKGGKGGLSSKREGPPTLSSEALRSKKNHQKCPKKGKSVKNAKSG
jgi:hypothetical protein